jgi:hypothetical protein
MKASFSSMTVYGYTLLDNAGAICPDACVEPHGRVYASCLFVQQYLAKKSITPTRIYNRRLPSWV